MSKQIEALKLALEALEGVATWVEVRPKTHPWDTWQRVEPAITAIKEALAQTQEPVATVESVATVVSELGNQEVTMSWWHEPALPVGTKLYTTPPQRTWVGLTEEEFQWIYDNGRTPAGMMEIVEAKLKELNT